MFEGYYMAFPDLQLTPTEIISDGDRVALFWTAQGTHQGSIMQIPPSGRAILAQRSQSAGAEPRLGVRDQHHLGRGRHVAGHRAAAGFVLTGRKALSRRAQTPVPGIHVACLFAVAIRHALIGWTEREGRTTREPQIYCPCSVVGRVRCVGAGWPSYGLRGQRWRRIRWAYATAANRHPGLCDLSARDAAAVHADAALRAAAPIDGGLVAAG